MNINFEKLKAYKLFEQSLVPELHKGVKRRAINALAKPELTILLARSRNLHIGKEDYHELTVAELCELPESSLASSRLVGPHTFLYIKSVLAAHNLRLGSKTYLDREVVEKIIQLYSQWEKAAPRNLKYDIREAVDYVISNYNMDKNNSI